MNIRKKSIVFQNEGILSLIDLTTMGDSSKREDSTKIGKFDSGLKYAISILYRNGIIITINVSDNIQYRVNSKIIISPDTKKEKEIIVIEKYLLEDVNIGFEYVESIETSFAIQLGYEWELWMALREIYSNCLDENGKILDDSDGIGAKGYTTIHLEGELLEPILENWDEYFISSNIEPIYGNKDDSDVKIYENPSGYLRLYKNGILIHKNEDVLADFMYDSPCASIDEMRVLNNMYDFKNNVSYCISENNSYDFTRTFLLYKNDGTRKTFEDGFDFYRISPTIKKVVEDLYNEYKTIITYDGLYSRLSKTDGVYIGEKRISSSLSNSWLSEAKVVIDESPEIENVEISFEDRIINICEENNFKLKYPIQKSFMVGFTCLPNNYDKIIFVTEEFTSDNMWEIIKAQFRIDSNDGEDYVYKKYAELLKK